MNVTQRRMRRFVGELFIESADYHRNGIAGVGFHVVKFRHERKSYLAVVFDKRGHVAVLDSESLEERLMPEHWRGDTFEADLREAVRLHQERMGQELLGTK